ncbi:hypothetical protein GEMRC1_005579 [Eukaryota sp. GEM-RC1]
MSLPYRFCDTLVGAHLKHIRDIELVKPFSTYLKKEYGAPTLEKYNTDIRKLNELRKAAGRIADSTEASRSVLIRYYTTLRQIQQQLPISPTEIVLPFSWCCSFNASNKFVSHYIEAEEAAVLYNLSAAYGHSAMSITKRTPEDLKRSIKEFCIAAGLFQRTAQLLDSTPQTGSLTPDLTQENLNMMKTLMLAQGQECFIEYARLQQIPSATLVKLIGHAAKLYEKVITLSKAPAFSDLIDRQWLARIHIKMMLFSAIPHQILAEKAAGTMEFGEQVGRLRYAHKLINVCFNKIGPSAAEMVPILGHAQKSISVALQAAEKENSTIYFMSVKSEKEFPPLEEHSMVEPKETELECTDPLFKGLMSKGDLQLLADVQKAAQRMWTGNQGSV